MTAKSILDANKQVVRRYIEEVINQGKVALIDDLFTPELAKSVKAFLSSDHNPFPDAHEEILEMVAEDDRVMVRWLFRGTQHNSFMGLAATGKTIEITGYGSYRLRDGRIYWDTMLMDWLDALAQLGVDLSTASRH